MQESRQEITTKSGETNLDAASHNGLEPALGQSAFNTTQIQKGRIPIPMTKNPLQVQVNNMTWKMNEITNKTKGNEDNMYTMKTWTPDEDKLRKITKSTMKTADRETREKATGKKCLR